MTTSLNDADMRDIRDNRFSGKTARIERPTSDQPAFRYSSPDQLAKLQADWDVADGWRKERENSIAAGEKERADKRTADEAAAKAKMDARTATKRDQTFAMLRTRYLAVPGMREADWEADKDQVLRDYARSQALTGQLDNAARAGVRSLVNPSTI